MTIQTDLSSYLVGALKGYAYPQASNLLREVYDITLQKLAALPQIWEDNFSTPYTLRDGAFTPDDKWFIPYLGYGKGGSDGKVFYMAPKTNQSGTSACLALSTTTFADFEVTFNMKSVRPTRTNPRNWERAWFMWRYADNTHHYYFYIKDTGIEVGRKDYLKIGTDSIQKTDGKIVKVDTQDKQTFLFTGGKTKFVWGKSYAVRLRHVGNNIKIWIDSILECDLVDDGKIGLDVDDTRPATAPTLTKGTLGLYGEDSEVNFDNVRVQSI